ncbi:MAG: hypothetical protein KAS38_04090 [Anaerolineales bacterium]|nr:hypothetical protein [Anaerolineales bacterium]
MDIDRATIVICLTLFIIIGINAAIYASFRRGTQSTTVDLLRKAAKRARDPWKVEDQALQELSDLTSQFRGDKDEGNKNGESQVIKSE